MEERGTSGAFRWFDSPPNGGNVAMDQVLVIDDHPGSLAVLDFFLTTHGFRVTSARSASEAMLRALEEPPDVVLTEYHLAEIDGARLADLLRAMPGLAATPMVALAPPATSTSGRAFDEVLAKPIAPGRVSEALRRCMRRRRRLRA